MIIKHYLKLHIRNTNQIEKAIEHTNYKYDPSLSSQTERVFYNPNTKETVISHAGTNFGSKMV